MKLLKALLLLTISLLVIFFALANRELILIHIILSEFVIELPLYVFFFTTLIIGILLGGGVSIFYRLKVKHMLVQKDKRIKALENELSASKIEATIDDAVADIEQQ